jgi:hypothetical protein
MDPYDVISLLAPLDKDFCFVPVRGSHIRIAESDYLNEMNKGLL